MTDERIRFREWSLQPFYDPKGILESIAGSSLGFVPANPDSTWKPLRNNELNQERQWLDGALFAMGLSQALRIDARIARYESEDFDFLLTWEDDREQNVCPVQLKELVSKEINPDAEINSLIAGLRKYAPSSDTVVAIKINRQMRFDPNDLIVPDLPFRQLWIFGSSSSDRAHWFLYGDVLSDAQFYPFDVPI